MKFESEAGDLAESSDEDLVQLILADGSEGAFRALYARHTPRLFRLALRLLGTDSDAEDALQECWLRACARLETFQWRSALSTWLASIVLNVARDALDKKGRWNDVELEEQMLVTAEASAMEPLDLERAIAALPPACRTAFVLHDMEGYTHGEIGELLGYTDGTSKSQVFRARRALRRLLGGAEVEEKKNAGT